MPTPLQIDQELIEHLGELARIRLQSGHQEALRAKLQGLVDAFSTLTEGDLESTSGNATHTVNPSQLRDDSADAPRAADEVLENAPQTAADCFVVSRVVEP